MRAERIWSSGSIRRLARERDGAAVLEFALVLPPLCMILLGMFEVGLVTFTQASMEGALRESARFGMTGRLEADPVAREAKILQIVDDYTLGLLDMDEATITHKVYEDFSSSAAAEPLLYDANGNGSYDAGDNYQDTNGDGDWDGDSGEAGLGAAAEIVQYTVRYDWPLMTPFMNQFMGNSEGKIPLEASVVLRNEPWE